MRCSPRPPVVPEVLSLFKKENEKNDLFCLFPLDMSLMCEMDVRRGHYVPLAEQLSLELQTLKKRQKPKKTRKRVSAPDISMGFERLDQKQFHLEFISDPAKGSLLFKQRGVQHVSELDAWSSHYPDSFAEALIQFHRCRPDSDPFHYGDGTKVNLTVKKVLLYDAIRIFMLSSTTMHRDTKTRAACDSLLPADFQHARDQLETEFYQAAPSNQGRTSVATSTAATSTASSRVSNGTPSKQSLKSARKGKKKAPEGGSGLDTDASDGDYHPPPSCPRTVHEPRSSIGLNALLLLHANLYIPCELEALMNANIQSLITDFGEASACDEKASGGKHEAPCMRHCRSKPGDEQVAIWFNTTCGVTEDGMPYCYNIHRFDFNSVTKEVDVPADMFQRVLLLQTTKGDGGSLIVVDSLYFPRASVKTLAESSAGLPPRVHVRALASVRRDAFSDLLEKVCLHLLFTKND